MQQRHLSPELFSSCSRLLRMRRAPAEQVHPGPWEQAARRTSPKDPFQELPSLPIPGMVSGGHPGTSVQQEKTRGPQDFWAGLKLYRVCFRAAQDHFMVPVKPCLHSVEDTLRAAFEGLVG